MIVKMHSYLLELVDSRLLLDEVLHEAVGATLQLSAVLLNLLFRFEQ